MFSDHGTDGIAHTIHVATEEDGELSNFREFENVLDVMNLPDGSVKFHYENGMKQIKDGRIVRSKVRGVEDSFRYRCSECQVQDTDIISQSDRGKSVVIGCHVCGKETEHKQQGIDDV